MDIGIYKFKEGRPSPSLMKEGKCPSTSGWYSHNEMAGSGTRMERHSVFDEEPWCLHVPKGVKVEVLAQEVSEVLIQKAHNERDFESKCYTPEDCKTEVFGEMY